MDSSRFLDRAPLFDPVILALWDVTRMSGSHVSLPYTRFGNSSGRDGLNTVSSIALPAADIADQSQHPWTLSPDPLNLDRASPGPNSLFYPSSELGQRSAGTGHPEAGCGEGSVWERGAAVAGPGPRWRGAGPPEYPDAAGTLDGGAAEAWHHPDQPGGHAHPPGWRPVDRKSGRAEDTTSESNTPVEKV